MPSYYSPVPSPTSSVAPSSAAATELYPHSPTAKAPYQAQTPQPTLSSHPPAPLNLPFQPSFPVALPFTLPGSGGLPVYSASGFDLLSILARVATRPNPKITLGPVDLTCSFVVADVRRFDHPIVYASPTFYKLTGYSESEVLGRNCRFLQAPGGQVQKGEPRRHTTPDAVAHLRKSLVADKECQVSMINYRKDGSAFMNLVTVIPIPGGAYNSPDEAEDVVYQVGFQVDLTEQPNAILQKLRDGSYMVNYSNNVAYPSSASSKEWKASLPLSGLSKQFRAVLNHADFVDSIPVSTSTTTLSIGQDKSDVYEGNKLLSLILLEKAPDFVQVLSLKGAFQYISPSVRRVLGYEPEDLIGKGLTDFCHGADKVPLVRELKEASVANASGNSAANSTPDDNQAVSPVQSTRPAVPHAPRVVDLLFRMRHKAGDYVWVECRGRLFVEPGKGRKAIILSARVRNIPSLWWRSVARAGGLGQPVVRASKSAKGERRGLEQECWALLGAGGSFLFIGAAVRDVLGWGAGEVIGRSILDFMGGHDPLHGVAVLEETLRQALLDSTLDSRTLSCELKKKQGGEVLVDLVFYRRPVSSHSPRQPTPATQPLLCQIKVSSGPQPAAMADTVHAPHADVFDELDVKHGSSWQYELQQLKFANQRLAEEVAELEGALERENRGQAELSQRRETPRARLPPVNTWANQHMAPAMSSSSSSLKRTWDGHIISDSHR